MNSQLFVLLLCIAACNAFHLASTRSFGSSLLKMNVDKVGSMTTGGTSPGKNLKPMFDGTFKEAGAHLEVYTLEHENGSKALVDTKTATCISWKNAAGVELITSKTSVHMFPDAATPLQGEFVPEERAKKVSFDRMIFKCNNPNGLADVEYRCDVTMRADSLEYDITLINAGKAAVPVSMALKFNTKGKVEGMKGYTTKTDSSVATGKWDIPAGKFKETCFYALIK